MRVLTYDVVVHFTQEPNRKRPIVLLGAKELGLDKLQNTLREMDASRFAVPLPVTTRAPRQTANGQLEQNGRDFHFVMREQFQENIAANRLADCWEFDGEFYGTSFESVRCVVQTGRVAIFIAHFDAIITLYESDVKPYFVFVAPPKRLITLIDFRIKLGATPNVCTIAK